MSNPSATLVLGESTEIDRWLDADEWYALVFEIATLIQKHLDLWDYDALHYAAAWLRGYGQTNG